MMAESSTPHPQTLPECCSCHTQSTDTLAIPCGHKYCQACTDGFFTEYEHAGSYSCSQCLQTFSTRPERDGPVHGIVERLSKTDLHDGAPADSRAGPEDTPCDTCTSIKQKAIKSCLVCLASYCETHLRLHNDLHVRSAHTLVDTTDQLHGLRCSVHDKLLEVYCREEQRCICCLCMLEDHKGHDTVSVAAGRAEKQEELKKSEQIIEEQEKQLKELNLGKNTLREMALATEEESERLFTELIQTIKDSCAMMKMLIRTQESAELNRVEELQKQVEQEIAEVKRKGDELEQLSHTKNDIHFLQLAQSLSLGSTAVPNTKVNPQFSFGEMINSISVLKLQIESIWQQEINNITAAVKKDKIVVPIEPKTREDFLQHLVPLSLDLQSAHPSLRVCEEKRAASCSTELQPYPDHPDRFSWWAQALCCEPLGGRCYWEVSWTGLYGVDVAVSYRDICKKGEGDECGFGYNKQSWSLDCSLMKYALVHDNQETEISMPTSHKIGVYVDHRAGVLSFYSVSDSMKLLHRVETKFKQPLYAGFGLYQGSTVRICQPDKEPQLPRSSPKENNNKERIKKALRRRK